MALLALFITWVSFSCIEAAGTCRCLPSRECWPDRKTWAAFNESIQGSLIATKPLASPCHNPDYNEEACKVVTEQWSDPFYRSDQPAALQGPNMEMDGEQGCHVGGDRSSNCSLGALPVYIVDASEVAHVQRAVSFAVKHNLRLVIKNTGHDFTGRNTAPGSLSIWVHHLKSIAFTDGFAPTGCTADSGSRGRRAAKSTSAVKVGAGVQWEELYGAAHRKEKVLVGAQCVSVGAAGGYVLGGGHSQMSPTFGLAADNVLEYEVVTADGKLLTANSCQNKELFWALRGGGGSTFGVVTSVTYTTHPALSNLAFASYVVTTQADNSFKELLAKLVSLNPSMSDAGWGGWFIVASKTLIFQYMLPNKDMGYANKTLQPLLTYLADPSNKLVVLSGKVEKYPSYYEWHRINQCSNGKCGYAQGTPQLEASRLVPRSVVEQSSSQLAEALLSLQESGYQRVSGYLVGGGKVAKPAENTAVNPAWRKALLHVLFVKPFAENSTMEMKRTFAEDLSGANKVLCDMTPGSGSYMNEGDRNEPQWQESFFGANYATLKRIKNKFDPNGLFVCNRCVGSEDWSEDLNCRLA